MHANLIKRVLAISSLALTASQLPAQDLRFGGFLSHGYIDSSRYNYLVDSEKGDFDFAEIGLNASWTPFERTTLNGQVFAFELGDYGNYEPQIDYLFVDYNFRKEIGIRAGRIKREFGIYTHIQDIDVSRASILLPMGIYDQRFRDFSASLDGISLYGSVELGKNSLIDYNFFAGWVDLKKEGGVGGFAATEISRIAFNPIVEEIDSDTNVGLQLWFNTPIDGLRIGAASQVYQDIALASSGILPPVPEFGFIPNLPFTLAVDNIRYHYTQFSFEYYVNDWTLIGEHLTTTADFDSVAAVAGMPVEVGPSSTKGDAWYLSLARRLGQFEGAVTYSEFYEKTDDRSGATYTSPSNAYSKDLQFSLRFDATENWSLKVETHSVHGTSRLFNELGQNPVIDQEAWTIWTAKSTFSF